MDSRFFSTRNTSFIFSLSSPHFLIFSVPFPCCFWVFLFLFSSFSLIHFHTFPSKAQLRKNEHDSKGWTTQKIHNHRNMIVQDNEGPTFLAGLPQIKPCALLMCHSDLFSPYLCCCSALSSLPYWLCAACSLLIWRVPYTEAAHATNWPPLVQDMPPPTLCLSLKILWIDYT